MTRLRTAVKFENADRATHVAERLEFVGETIVRSESGDSLPRDVGTVFTNASTLPSERHVAWIRVSEDGACPDGFVAALRVPLALPDVLAALHAAEQYRAQQRFDWPHVEKATLRFAEIAGTSPQISAVREALGKIARRDVTVLLTGERGTGKEYVARALHRASSRSDGPFVPLDVAAMPLELLDGELFGHEKGAFSGAVATRAGRFELAQGGTLFLGGICELPMPIQMKLLRVLQERSVERVGGSAPIKTNVRLVVATNRDLETMVRTGEFREDLYYRLNAIPIAVPALRERAQDIPALVDAFVADAATRHGARVRFDAHAMDALQRYGWPGNVRELASIVERVAIAHPGEVVGAEQLPPRFTSQGDEAPSSRETVARGEDEGLIDPDRPPSLPVNGIDLKDYLNRLERSLIRQALDDTDSVVARAADRLHIRRTTLVEKMRKYGLQRSDSL